MTDTEYDTAIAAMRAAGERDGKAAGGWIADGNTTEEALRLCLQQWEDGDPAAPCAPSPFSGEWAGDPSIEDVVNAETELDAECEPEELDELASAYEDAYAEAWQASAEATVRGLLRAYGVPDDTEGSPIRRNDD